MKDGTGGALACDGTMAVLAGGLVKMKNGTRSFGRLAAVALPLVAFITAPSAAFGGSIFRDSAPWTVAHGRDGQYYGSVLQGNSPGGYVYRLSAEGRATKVHQFPRIYASPHYSRGGSEPEGNVSVAQDGSIYGATRDGGVFAGGVIYKIDPKRGYRVVHHILDGWGYKVALLAATNGDVFAAYGWPSQLLRLTKDGLVAAVAAPGDITALAEAPNHDILVATGYQNNALWRFTPNNDFQKIAPIDVSRTLIPLEDGSVLALGQNYLMQVSASGNSSVLHSFDTRFDGTAPNFLVRARDGSFIGSTLEGGVENSGVLFRFLLGSNTYTSVRSFPSTGGRGAAVPWTQYVFPHLVAATSGNSDPRAMDDVVPASQLRAADGGLPAADIPVLRNDSDADGDPISIVSVGAPEHGTVDFDFVAQRVTYTAEAADVQNDSFDYTIVDGSGGTSTARVAIRTNPAGPYLGDISSPTDANTGDPGTVVGSLSAVVTNSHGFTARLQLLGRTFRFTGKFNEVNEYGTVLQRNGHVGTWTSVQLLLHPTATGWTLEANVRKNGLRFGGSCVLQPK